jgi:hypothetical protein
MIYSKEKYALLFIAHDLPHLDRNQYTIDKKRVIREKMHYTIDFKLIG